MNINGVLALLYMFLFPVFTITLLWLVGELGMSPFEALGVGAILGQMATLLVLIFQYYFRKKPSES